MSNNFFLLEKIYNGFWIVKTFLIIIIICDPHSVCNNLLNEWKVCVDVGWGIPLRRKLDFSAKKNEFPFCRRWISSGDTAGNPANCFQIRSEMGLLLQRRHFAFLSHIECIDLKLWLTWLQIDINYQSLWLPAGTSLQRRLLLVSWQTTGWL